MSASAYTYYYLSDYSDEIVPFTPTLDGIRDWLSQPDPQWHRKRAARPGEQFDLDTLTVLDWCKATWDGAGWTLDKQFPAVDLLAVVDDYGDTTWMSDDILYGETLDQMLANYLADIFSGSAEELSPVWIACAEGNKKPMVLTYKGPGQTPDVAEKVMQ